MGRKLAYLDTPDGETLEVGPVEIGYLETLVRDGPFPSVTAWVRAHIGRDHGYRREDVWRYVTKGMARVDNPPSAPGGRPPGGSYGQVQATQHTRAIVAWYRGEDDPALHACLEAGWTIRPGSAQEASGLRATTRDSRTG